MDNRGTFKRALGFVFEAEGGYSNDPDDSGGATQYGITQKTYDRWNLFRGIPLRPVSEITHEEAEDIYFHFYWLEGKCDQLPDDVGVAHFDWCVNRGPRGAAVTLQLALGVPADGIIGPKTIAAVAKYEVADLLIRYLTEREKCYKTIVAEKPSQKKFINGWLNRVDKLARFLKLDFRMTR